MAYTFPLPMPIIPPPRGVTWAPLSNRHLQRSLFTTAAKVYGWEGQKRRVTIEFPPIISITWMKAWQVWLLRLNNTEKTFYFAPGALTPRRGAIFGIPGYTPLVHTGGAREDTLITKAWPVSVANVIRKGDWIAVRGRLYQITADASSDGDGNAILKVWPSMGLNDVNDPVTLGDLAFGTFRLYEPANWRYSIDHHMVDWILEAEEAV